MDARGIVSIEIPVDQILDAQSIHNWIRKDSPAFKIFFLLIAHENFHLICAGHVSRGGGVVTSTDYRNFPRGLKPNILAKKIHRQNQDPVKEQGSLVYQNLNLYIAYRYFLIVLCCE